MVHVTLSLQNVGPAKFSLHVVAYATSVTMFIVTKIPLYNDARWSRTRKAQASFFATATVII
jgi:hypothetical protein